jgi:AraC family transcriptional regulator of adaptative response/methylated-DNA-[protein]-cysteine methyltransferase
MNDSSRQPASQSLKPGDFDRVARAIEFMVLHAAERPGLSRIAREAGWSEWHFARVFRRWAGISPKQLLQHLALLEAQRSLADRRPVLQAALDAGLSGPGRLHDLFVTLAAVTPGEFKSRGRGLAFRHGTAGTPFGTARVALNERGIAFLAFGEDAAAEADWQRFRATWQEASWIRDEAAAAEVAARIWGATHDGRPLALWVHGTNFQVQVWRALLERGARATTSYGELARDIGRPAACRAVGGAVGDNPVAWLIPCHHVLRASGALGGYRWGEARKRAMLAWEVAQSLRSGSSRPRREPASRASPPCRRASAAAR